MNSDLINIKARYNQALGKKDNIESSLQTLTKSLRKHKEELVSHEKARIIIDTVGINTQKQLQYHISDITSLALEAVFPDPYKLIAEFVQRRNKTECDLYFERDGDRIEPLDSSGYGAVDIAAFALRVASWSMLNPKTRPTIILDEPMRYLSIGYHNKAGEMIKEISKRLGLQFIIITHSQELAETADKTFRTQIKRGITKVYEE